MIVGISGKMRTGKNVVADYLVSHYGFKQIAFADALKKLGIEYFGLSYEECYGEKTVKSRKILQEIGVKWREIDEDVWCRYVLKNVGENDKITISDVRFPNEAALIKKYKGYLIRVNRDIKNEFGMDHISETALDEYVGFDYILDNNGTLNELYAGIDDVLNSIGR